MGAGDGHRTAAYGRGENDDQQGQAEVVHGFGYEQENESGDESRGEGAREHAGAGLEVSPVDHSIDSARCQSEAEIHQGDDQGKERVLCCGKHAGEDQVCSGKSEPRRSVDHHTSERRRVPQTSHALGPVAFDSIMV